MSICKLYTNIHILDITNLNTSNIPKFHFVGFFSFLEWSKLHGSVLIPLDGSILPSRKLSHIPRTVWHFLVDDFPACLVGYGPSC